MNLQRLGRRRRREHGLAGEQFERQRHPGIIESTPDGSIVNAFDFGDSQPTASYLLTAEVAVAA